jgi:type II secretory pathway pseudopilin PulG
MGILAAVAVPKLFGMIAKSKASEVGPAAGTYVKLQQAYFSEANTYGGWVKIGYTGPGTSVSTTSTHSNNFQYSGTAINANSGDITAATANAWVAHNKAKLNDCDVGDNWHIDLTAVTDSKDAYTAVVTAGGCSALTPTFDKIGN